LLKKFATKTQKEKKEKKPIEELATGLPPCLPATSPTWRALPPPPVRRAAQELAAAPLPRRCRSSPPRRPQEMPELASAPHLPAAACAACQVQSLQSPRRRKKEIERKGNEGTDG